MATNPTGNTGPSKDQTRQTIADINEAKKAGGDFNDILKDSVNQLKKIANLYDDIESRLKSMDASSINIKEINTQLFKAKEKDALTTKKLQAAEEKLGKDSENKMKQYLSSQTKIAEMEQRRLKYEKLGLSDKVKDVDYLLTKEIARNERLKDGLSINELEVISLRQSEKYTKSLVGLAKQKLKEEKEVRKELGYSGVAMGLFAKKLGLGNEVYEQMVEKAKNLKKEGEKIGFFDKLGILSKGIAGGALDALTDPLTMIPLIGGAVVGAAKGLKSIFDYIVGIQDKTVKFARAMNVSTEEARQLKMQYADINVANGDLFVNTEKLIEAQTEMVGLLGITNQLSTQNLATNIKLKDIAGVEADTIASITQSSIINGKSNESIVKSVFAQVKGLKQATGIQFENKQILKEASSFSGVLGLQFSKYPAQLTKSLLTVKAMGMELKQLDAMADSFLDFESSISKEFEAQLLTGKEINLAKAREMFLNNDLAGAAAEINKQVGSSADFMKMRRIEQEAFAGAMGMSRDDMGDMLKKQEMLSKLGAKDTDNSREQLRLGLAKYKNQKALSEAIGEEAYQNLVNASLQEKIAAFIEKIKQSISDFVEKSGIIGKIEKMMAWLSKPENIRSAMMYVRDIFASIIGGMGKVAAVIMKGANFFGAGIDESTIEAAMNAGDSIRSMGGDLSMTAAKERAGIGATNTTGNSQDSNRFGSKESLNVSGVVIMDGRQVGIIGTDGIKKGSQGDNQISAQFAPK